MFISYFWCAGVKISVEQPRGLRAVLKSVYNSPPLNDLTFYQPPDQDKYGHCTLQVRRFAKSHSVKNADGILSLMLLAGFFFSTNAWFTACLISTVLRSNGGTTAPSVGTTSTTSTQQTSLSHYNSSKKWCSNPKISKYEIAYCYYALSSRLSLHCNIIVKSH